MTNSALLLTNIEHLGRVYCTRYLDWNREVLEADWFEALKFFLVHSFMRGRRDELSVEFYFFAIDRIQNDILAGGGDGSYRVLQGRVADFDRDFLLNFKRKYRLGKKSASKHVCFLDEVANQHEVIRLLTTPKTVTVGWGGKTYKKSIMLGNDEDVLMVLDTLQFVCSEQRRNIYTYLCRRIDEGGVRAAYSELTQLRAVKDKIATFVIRDIALMNPGLGVDDYSIAFPVDTWVRRLAARIGCTAASEAGIKQHFIDQCRSAGRNTLLVAAGLWYLGFHSLDILLDHFLDEYEIGFAGQGDNGAA